MSELVEVRETQRQREVIDTLRAHNTQQRDRMDRLVEHNQYLKHNLVQSEEISTQLAARLRTLSAEHQTACAERDRAYKRAHLLEQRMALINQAMNFRGEP